MVCTFLEDNGVPLSPLTSPSKGWVVVVGGNKNASAVVGVLLLIPPTCAAGNEGSSVLVVSSPSVGARGGRLGMSGSRERYAELVGVATLVVQPEIQLVDYAHSHLSSRLLFPLVISIEKGKHTRIRRLSAIFPLNFAIHGMGCCRRW